MNNQAVLVLADGAVFEGISLGQAGHICGEVVFNTAQTGYQEILTDPSYAEQIIVFTQPHIGNVGVNIADEESHRSFAKGAVLRHFSAIASNWRAEETLTHFLKKQNLIVISEVDTRALTHHLRQFGSQAGCLMAGEVNIQKALHYAQQFPSLSGRNLVQAVTTDKPYTLNKGKSLPYHVVVYDLGVKSSILNCLFARGCSVTVVPATTKAQDVFAMKPDGILLSNGPGDPAACLYMIETIKDLLKQSIPMMAICLGHQLLALASGAVTKKMGVGHHGANHPIQCLKTGKVLISSQNHGFVVVDEDLPSCLRITHRSLFDGSIAGIERKDLPVFGFQGHPEGGPGPTELTTLFDHFTSLMGVHQCQKELISKAS